MPRPHIHGEAAFRSLWIGQSLAELGAGLTGFALGVWVYEQTGSAAQFGVVAACRLVPGLVVAPLAGTLIDRWNLRAAMLFGHLGALIGALATVALLAVGEPQIWQLCLVTAGISAVTSLQWPAFTSATTVLVPRERLDRASGLVQFGESTAQLLAPALGGTLLQLIGLWGVVLLEVASLAVALASCLPCVIPQVSRPADSGSWAALLRDTAEGFSYLQRMQGLLGLLVLSCVLNSAVSFLEVLSAPIILAVGTSADLGFVRSFAGAGMLAGSVAVATRGGPRQRVLGVIRFQILFGVFIMLMALARAPLMMAILGFCGLACIPLINACSQPLWQTNVDLQLQGRVFALRRLTGVFRGLGFLLAGILADAVFEPYMASLGRDALVARLVGVGDGRGSALTLFLMGALTAAVTCLAYVHQPLLGLERSLRDVTPRNDDD